MKKRIVTVLMVLAYSTLISGCGNKDIENSIENSEYSEESVEQSDNKDIENSEYSEESVEQSDNKDIENSEYYEENVEQLDNKDDKDTKDDSVFDSMFSKKTGEASKKILKEKDIVLKPDDITITEGFEVKEIVNDYGHFRSKILAKTGDLLLDEESEDPLPEKTFRYAEDGSSIHYQEYYHLDNYDGDENLVLKSESHFECLNSDEYKEQIDWYRMAEDEKPKAVIYPLTEHTINGIPCFIQEIYTSNMITLHCFFMKNDGSCIHFYSSTYVYEEKSYEQVNQIGDETPFPLDLPYIQYILATFEFDE